MSQSFGLYQEEFNELYEKINNINPIKSATKEEEKRYRDLLAIKSEFHYCGFILNQAGKNYGAGG